MTTENTQFIFLMEKVANSILQGFLERKLDRDTLEEIRHTLYERFCVLFKRCQFSLADVTIRWLSETYFKLISINGDEKQVFGDMYIAPNEVKAKELPLGDIETLLPLFHDSIIADELETERHRRS
jgi:hypothetical protein